MRIQKVIEVIALMALILASVTQKHSEVEKKIVTRNQDTHIATSNIPTTQKEEVEPQIDLNMIERVVAAEALDQGYEGQLAVAQTIKERATKTGKSLYEVVTEPLQYADPLDESLVSDTVRKACEDAFINGTKVVDEPITFFYSVRGGFYSKWHETSPKLEFVTQIGDHKFFKEVT